MAKGKGKREAAPDDSGKKRGRPPLFKKEHVEQVYEIALLGANDVEIATILGVSERTVNYWKKSSPEFLQALNSGKIEADARVVDSLYQRAVGYSHPAVKIFCSDKGGVTQVPFTEHYPPDVTACIFWLKNRRRKEWREKVDVAHDVTNQLAERLMAARKRTARPGKGEGKGEGEEG